MDPLALRLNKSFLHKILYPVYGPNYASTPYPNPSYWAFGSLSNCTCDFKRINRSPESPLLTIYLFLCVKSILLK